MRCGMCDVSDGRDISGDLERKTASCSQAQLQMQAPKSLTDGRSPARTRSAGKQVDECGRRLLGWRVRVLPLHSPHDQPVRSCRPGEERAAAAGRPAAAQEARRGRRPGSSRRRRGHADAHARSRAALPSMILWGPPGSRQDHGRAPAGATRPSSSSSSCPPSSRACRTCARRSTAPRRGASRASGTLLFIDEIHRFNRAQQDSFLPHMEDGTITLVGATTENPSFELNAAAAVARAGAGASTGSTTPRWSCC